MAGGDQGAIDRREHALGAADRVEADRRQGIGDGEHGEAPHAASTSQRPSSAVARAARVQKRAPSKGKPQSS